MQWDASPHAGFTTGEPWIALNPNHAEINAQAARADPDSVFHTYRRLIELRHTEPAVAHGDFTMLLEDDETVYAFTRRLGGTELLVVANFSGAPVTPALEESAWAGGEVLVGSVQGHAHDGLALRQWEARVHRRVDWATSTTSARAGAALDAIELDVARRARARHERERPRRALGARIASGTPPRPARARRQTWRSDPWWRRPLRSPPSSTIVPVSAIASAQPVSTPSIASSSSLARPASSTSSTPRGRQPLGSSAGTARRVAPRARQASPTAPASLRARTRVTVAS
jgi:hypothetical protein